MHFETTPTRPHHFQHPSYSSTGSTSSIRSTSSSISSMSSFSSSSSISSTSASTSFPSPTASSTAFSAHSPKTYGQTHQRDVRIVLKHGSNALLIPKAASLDDLWTDIYEHFLIRRPDDPAGNLKCHILHKGKDGGQEEVLGEDMWHDVKGGDVLTIVTESRHTSRESSRAASEAGDLPTLAGLAKLSLPTSPTLIGGSALESPKPTSPPAFKSSGATGLQIPAGNSRMSGMWAADNELARGIVANGGVEAARIAGAAPNSPIRKNSTSMMTSISPGSSIGTVHRSSPEPRGADDIEVGVRTLTGPKYSFVVPPTTLVRQLRDLYCLRTGTTDPDSRLLLDGTLQLKLGVTLAEAHVKEGALLTVFP